jgi:hypothetical protein
MQRQPPLAPSWRPGVGRGAGIGELGQRGGGAGGGGARRRWRVWCDGGPLSPGVPLLWRGATRCGAWRRWWCTAPGLQGSVSNLKRMKGRRGAFWLSTASGCEVSHHPWLHLQATRPHAPGCQTSVNLISSMLKFQSTWTRLCLRSLRDCSMLIVKKKNCYNRMQLWTFPSRHRWV